MSQALQRAGTTEQGLTLRQCLKDPRYIARFEQVLGARANQFIASLIQVGSSYQLEKCEPNSVIAAAITAAALDLPIDKNLGFAHIVPYKTQASFQLGAKGLVQLAIRTGQYKFLNCCVVRDGELAKYDELTGEVVLDTSKRKSEDIVGYAAYFKLVNGYEHAEYWTKQEVDDHAKRYSQAYKAGYETPWKTNFDAMALKTVIKSLLSHWGIMSIEMQKAITHDQGVQRTMDAEVEYPDNTPKAPAQLGPVVDADDGDLGPQDKKVVVEQPLAVVQDLAVDAEVSEDQILAVLKAKKMCDGKVVELMQVSDSALRKLAANWANLVGEIKAVQI